MQTRKNRKNDETSYEKMLKLRRDLSRAVTLLEMVKRREKTKREQLHLSIEIFEKRFHIRDFSGSVMSEITTSLKNARSAFAPIYANQYSHHSSMSQSNLISSTSSSGTGNHHYSSSQYLNSTATGLSSGIVGTNNISQSVGSNNKRGDIDITRKEKDNIENVNIKYNVKNNFLFKIRHLLLLNQQLNQMKKI